MPVSGRSSVKRVRCKACGSTRVRAITLGYLDGPLAVIDGRVVVTEGEWTAHEADRIEQGSVICANCGGGDYRVVNAS